MVPRQGVLREVQVLAFRRAPTRSTPSRRLRVPSSSLHPAAPKRAIRSGWAAWILLLLLGSACPTPAAAGSSEPPVGQREEGTSDGVWYWTLPDTPNGLRPTQSWSGAGSAPDGDIYVAGMDHRTNAALYRLRAEADPADGPGRRWPTSATPAPPPKPPATGSPARRPRSSTPGPLGTGGGSSSPRSTARGSTMATGPSAASTGTPTTRRAGALRTSARGSRAASAPSTAGWSASSPARIGT